MHAQSTINDHGEEQPAHVLNKWQQQHVHMINGNGQHKGACKLQQAHHLEAHVILEEDIVVVGDGKVMWIEEGLLHGKGLP